MTQPTKFYLRIQPAGLGVNEHHSEAGNGLVDGVFAFELEQIEYALIHPEGYNYGDEVLVLSADNEFDPGDVEGVVLQNPTILARFSWDELAEVLDGYHTDWETGLNGYIELTGDDTDSAIAALQQAVTSRG